MKDQLSGVMLNHSEPWAEWDIANARKVRIRPFSTTRNGSACAARRSAARASSGSWAAEVPAAAVTHPRWRLAFRIRPPHSMAGAEGEGEMTGRRPAGRRWTAAEENQLQEMLDAGMTAQEIARKLKRTAQAIYARMQRLDRKRDPSSTRP